VTVRRSWTPSATRCSRRVPAQHAAEELLRKFPAATKTLKLFMGLFPRPVSPDTFEICCAAFERAPDRPGFRVIQTKEEQS
jgi:hypothetical protein